MELILENVNFFDKGIGEKFEQFFENNIELFNCNKYYRLAIMYNNNPKIVDYQNSIFCGIDAKSKKNKSEEIYSSVVNSQFKQIEDALNRVGIKTNHLTAYGQNLENSDSIIIKIVGVDKEAAKIKLRSVMPDVEYSHEVLLKHIVKNLTEVFDDIHERIDDIEQLCKILDIKPSKKIEEISYEFVKKYYYFAFERYKIIEHITQRMRIAMNENQERIRN